MNEIDSFSGKYRYMSNFFPARTRIKVKYLHPNIQKKFRKDYDFEGTTSEHCFQAAKMTNLEDFNRVISVNTPSLANNFGRLLPIRDDWDDIRLEIMYLVVMDKFKRNKVIRELLKRTKEAELIEGNTWGDQFWGVCKGEGKNHLGKILMEVRSKL